MKYLLATHRTEPQFSFNSHPRLTSFDDMKSRISIRSLFLPEQVSNIVMTTRRLFGENEAPTFWYGSSNRHGGDMGIVFLFSQSNIIDPNNFLESPAENSLPFYLDDLTVRISFGAPDTNDEWDTTQYGRLHLGVRYLREFFPNEPENLVDGDEFSTVVENHHFSMRWEDGSYSDHTLRDDSQMLNPTRNSYSTAFMTKSGRYYRHEGFNQDSLAALLKHSPRRDVYLKGLLNLDEGDASQGLFDYILANSRGGSFSDGQGLQDGQLPLLRHLSNHYPNIDFTNPNYISAFSEEEGSTFFCEKILPAMMAFRNSQR